MRGLCYCVCSGRPAEQEGAEREHPPQNTKFAPARLLGARFTFSHHTLSIIHPTPPSTPHSLSSCPGGGYGVRPRYPSRTLPEPAVTRLPPSGASPRVIRGRRLFRHRRRRRPALVRYPRPCPPHPSELFAARWGRVAGVADAAQRGLFLVGGRRPPPPPPIPPGSQEGGNYLLGGEWMDTDTRFFRPRSHPAVSPPIAA